MKDKKYHKVRSHCYYTGEYKGALHCICNSKNSVHKEITIAFHNGLNYDYYFIIKESEFTCLRENTQEYITFTLQIENKITRIDKSGE